MSKPASGPMNDPTSDAPRDPFEEAAEQEFRRPAPRPEQGLSEADGAAASERPEPFGRDARSPDAGEGNGPTATRRPHTPIAGTPPDDPMIYRDASDRQMAEARSAAPDERPVHPADPVVADPTGERFREGPFANEPGWLEPGPKNAQLCYWLNLAGFMLFVFPLVSVVLAILNRPKVGAELGTHYTYAMRTVFLGVLYGVLAYSLGRAGGLALLAVVVWFVWRNLRGLARVGSGQLMPSPHAWLV